MLSERGPIEVAIDGEEGDECKASWGHPEAIEIEKGMGRVCSWRGIVRKVIPMRGGGREEGSTASEVVRVGAQRRGFDEILSSFGVRGWRCHREGFWRERWRMVAVLAMVVE